MTDPYADTFQASADEYGPKALELLTRIRDACRAANMATDGPVDISADEYSWSLVVWRTPEKGAIEDCIDILVKLDEQREYEGGDAYGLNFSLDIVEWGGQIIGGFAPFNYTPEVWVDGRDAQAVKERWELFAGADHSPIPDLILNG